jgi:hypothetical protein
LKKICYLIFIGFISSVVGYRIWLQHVTSTPDPELKKIYYQEVQCAKRYGFRFITPKVREMSAELSRRWNIIGQARVDVILIRKDDDFKATIAHELGHIIDFEMWRRGHPDFKRMKNLPNEEFADEIGQIILDHCPEVQNP